MTKRYNYTEYDDGTQSIHDSINDDFYFCTDLEKLCNHLNNQHNLINIIKNDISNEFFKLNRIQKKALEFNKRDLTPVERIFLKNFCKEAGIPVFCESNEEKFCENCRDCIEYTEDYYLNVI